ncbi:MAG: glycosyltransferase family 4 protein [Pirellulaceae bacterium]
MPESPPTIAYLTAGAAGMYCGSCMHDNTLARALARCGLDVQLIPTYTPIRTDEDNISVDRVFFGGINVYLQQKVPLFRHLPGLMLRFLDQPWLIRWASARAVEIDAKELGALTLSMLRGEHGFQKRELRRLCLWLRDHVKPDLVVLSNMLIAGCVPQVKRETGAPVLVTLQGDDIFLEELPEPFKQQAFEEIRKLVEEVDGFIVNSRYYAEFMGDYFGIGAEKFHIVPLGIDTDDYAAADASGEKHADIRADDQPLRVGYLARLAPEKGLHVLVDAFLALRKMPGMERAELHIAGWLGEHRRKYAEEQFDKLRGAGLGDAFHYAGSVDHHGKIDFLRSLDVLSVPTVYHEPKGLFVLEALAAGVPVVEPEHGAFPEMLAATSGGRLVRPEDPAHLAETLHELLAGRDICRELGQRGCAIVRQQFNATSMARQTLQMYGKFVPGLLTHLPVGVSEPLQARSASK